MNERMGEIILMKQRFFLYVCLSLILTAAVCPPAAAQTIVISIMDLVLA